jgi:hypothetical protein
MYTLTASAILVSQNSYAETLRVLNHVSLQNMTLSGSVDLNTAAYIYFDDSTYIDTTYLYDYKFSSGSMLTASTSLDK